MRNIAGLKSVAADPGRVEVPCRSATWGGSLRNLPIAFSFRLIYEILYLPRGVTLEIYGKRYIAVEWKLVQYVSPNGRKLIDDWRSSLTTTRTADLDTFLRNMAKKSRWAYPDLAALRGKNLKGLYELRWRSENGVPHRIGGYFAADHEFVMLIGWTHNKKKYDPPSALETLLQRRKNLLKGDATLDEFTILTSRTA